jgi:integrase
MTSSEQTKIEEHAPAYLRNVIRIITETGLRVYKELAPMKKEQVDLAKRTVFITDSKTPTGVAEVPLTDIAVEAFRSQTGRTSLHADREKLRGVARLGSSQARALTWTTRRGGGAGSTPVSIICGESRLRTIVPSAFVCVSLASVCYSALSVSFI